MSQNPDETAKQEEFRSALALSGLSLDAAERDRMFEGYQGLRTLLDRMPRNLPMADEPAIIAAPHGVRSKR